GAMNHLLEVLSDGDDDSKTAAHEALERITGAALAEADPEPKYREGEQPFLRSFNPPEPRADLTADGRIWTAWWGAHQQHAKENIRYRYGSPWSFAQTLWDLEDERASLPSRRLAHVELVVRSGGAAALNLEGFVARQLKQISAWKAFLAARARESRAGTWST